MRIYVASHDRAIASDAAGVLVGAGHSITSAWHEKEFLPTDQHTLEERFAIATEDFVGVAEADALVLIAGPDRYSGGKFVEAGIAIGLQKYVVVIGRRENMLLYLPQIMQVDTPEKAAIVLSSLESQTPPPAERDAHVDNPCEDRGRDDGNR